MTEIRTTSATGGLKGVKPERYSFIPKAPLDLLARIYGYGNEKYGDAHNYRKGYEWSKNYDALQRHLTSWWNREDNDPESGLSHLGHAAWHIFSLIVFSSDPKYKQYDDRYGDDFNLNESKTLNSHAICFYEDALHSVSHVCLEHGQTSKYGKSEGPHRACQAVDPWVLSTPKIVDYGLILGSDFTSEEVMQLVRDNIITTNAAREWHQKYRPEAYVEELSEPIESERPFTHPNDEKVACDYGYVAGPGGSTATGYYLCKVHECRTNRHPSEGANRPCIYIDPTGHTNTTTEKR